MPHRVHFDIRSERAQGAFEYLLVVGGVVVVFAAALLNFDTVVADALGHICPSVDTANPAAAVGSCLGIS